ncbi:MAG: type II/IV secretion system ATPase subunit, partial [Candidatus Methanoperedens sp.]|nr:type II/IV secretion system ATPase subunit [Candidatus Methanoperedens sp.]
GLGILEDVLSDERVTDVYVNSPADINPIHIVVEGEECISNIYLSQDDIDSMITRFRAISGRPFGEANPVLDMDLSEFKTRVSVIGNPLAAGGLAYAFRKHANNPWTLPKLINMGSITPLAAGLLSFLIDGQSSILVAGGVGAGKTSLLAAMLLEIPQKYRILTIEDTPELPIEALQKIGWKIQGMNTKSSVGGSEAEIAPEMALRAALRMGNSTLVLGEVRGPEVKVLYEAMQVGAAGNSVIGTIHGASTRAVFERIVNSLGVPAASFRATEAVVVCQNVRLSGTMSKKKRVVQIAEVTTGEWKDNPDADDIFNDIMVFDPASDRTLATDLLDKGQSELVNKIAGKWGLTIDEALLNIKMRAMIKQTIANTGKDNPEFLEADVVGKANNMFWYYQEEERDEKGKVDYQAVYQRWIDWYSAFVEKNK